MKTIPFSRKPHLDGRKFQEKSTRRGVPFGNDCSLSLSEDDIMRVLIAEDDPTSRILLESTLKKWGFDVVCTEDGDAAWETLRNEDAPRLAILDWVMPGKSGPEICQLVRQTETRDPTHIILLTSMNRKEDIVTGLEAGANDYVTKPFNREELRARINVGKRLIELQSALAQRVAELESALSHVRTLQGILPICMHCHKIRNDQESWERIDSYIQDHSEAQFSHSLCPECLETLYPDDDRGE